MLLCASGALWRKDRSDLFMHNFTYSAYVFSGPPESLNSRYNVMSQPDPGPNNSGPDFMQKHMPPALREQKYPFGLKNLCLLF